MKNINQVINDAVNAPKNFTIEHLSSQLAICRQEKDALQGMLHEAYLFCLRHCYIAKSEIQARVLLLMPDNVQSNDEIIVEISGDVNGNLQSIKIAVLPISVEHALKHNGEHSFLNCIETTAAVIPNYPMNLNLAKQVEDRCGRFPSAITTEYKYMQKGFIAISL